MARRERAFLVVEPADGDLAGFVRDLGACAQKITSLGAALSKITKQQWAGCVVDDDIARGRGLALVEEARRADNRCPILLVGRTTAQARVHAKSLRVSVADKDRAVAAHLAKLVRVGMSEIVDTNCYRAA